MEENKIKQVDSIDNKIKSLKKEREYLANNTEKERFNIRKFFNGLINPFNLTLWVKDFVSVFNVRKLLIIGLIVIILFGTGWAKGRGSKPVLVNSDNFEVITTIKEGINKGEGLRIKVEDGRMFYQIIKDNGVTSKEYTVRTKDIPKLKAFGIELKPKVFAGLGTTGVTAGFGFELANFWRFNLDTFMMANKSIYLGISYDIVTKNKFLSNSAVGVALGKNLSNVQGSEIMLYWSIKF